MNDTANSAVQAEDEAITAVPNLKPDAWQMPEPVFRKTSGRLPKPFEEKVATDVSAPDPSPAIDLQTPSAPIQTPDPGPKSPVLKLVVVLLALTAMIAFIAAFLTAVYFFFWRS
jgi:hypothetical protein